MSAVPVGYEAFTNLRRKGVTLLCILLASSLAMGITVYVDSYSIHEWTSLVDEAGPVAMEVTGEDLHSIINHVRNLEGVLRVQGIIETSGTLWNINNTEGIQYGENGGLITLSEDYFTDFPDVYAILQGRYPETSDEIAINNNRNGRMDAQIGDIINYSRRGDYGIIQWTQLEVVGFYIETTPDGYGGYRQQSVAIIEVSPVDSEDTISKLHLDIDRSPLNPFNARGSLLYVMNIEESIRRLDITYPDFNRRSKYNVDNFLADKIEPRPSRFYD